MRATLLCFSGRPNPEWVLQESEVRHLCASLRVLPGTFCELPRTFVGYTGVGVELAPGEKMIAYQGVVEVISPGESRRFVDMNRALEDWLLRTGVGVVDAAVLERLLADKGR